MTASQGSIRSGDEVSTEEGWAILEEAAQRHLHMSASEFVEAWTTGKFDHKPDRPEVMHVVALLPFARTKP